jgi:molybdate transport system ATP-binding protein
MPLAITLDFELRQGDFHLEVRQRLATDALALVGPSGAGKTSILESIAGLRRPTAGEIGIGGRTLFSSAWSVDVPARARDVGYVPQDALLFPHMDVRRNILYGASRGRRFSLDRVVEVLEIAPLVDRRIDRLSGGERQRVALARALMSSPSLLLLDEPLAALDPSLRWRIVPYLQRIRDELHLPMICVSHDPALVQAVADTALRLEHGRVVAAGPPTAVSLAG